MEKYKYLQETTVWDKTDLNIPNHVYILDKRGWLVGYIKDGTNETVMFSAPMKTFSKKLRTFKDITNAVE